MPSTANLKKRYFPSYGQIEQRIINEHKKKHQQKIEDLQKKISQLQGALNIEKEHQQIKKSLLKNYHSMNHQFMKNIIGQLNDDQEKLQKQDYSNQWGNGTSNFPNQNSASNSYSLNYCIDQDIEEDNHYENHLKFKKQVLERDLFDNLHTRKDKKKFRDEQFIFKNLYNPRPSTALALSSSQKQMLPRKVQNNYMVSMVSDNTKEFKQNFKHLDKSNSRPSSKNLSSTFYQTSKQKLNNYSSNKSLRKQSQQDQFMQQHNICVKNTKILKDSYGKYLKQLSGTNIIKWRVLGGQKSKESVNSSTNATYFGNRTLQQRQTS